MSVSQKREQDQRCGGQGQLPLTLGGSNHFATCAAWDPTGPIKHFFDQHRLAENVSKIRGVDDKAN